MMELEFATWAWRAILVWFGLLAVLDIVLKTFVEKREKRAMREMEENDDTDW